MIEVFYGDDRVRASAEINKALGENHETIDCADLTPADLPTIFYGATLFAAERQILLRDFFANRAIAGELSKYLDTPHQIIILELKLDKRSVSYKDLKDKLKFQEFKLPVKQDFRQVFDIYRVAKRDGKKAVRMLREIQASEDPIMFVGLLSSQAIKDYAARPTDPTAKRALIELSRTDMQLKTTSTSPWLLVESFLLRVSSR